MPIKDFATVTCEILANGATRLKGCNNLVTEDGSVASWTGICIAKNKGQAFPTGNYAVCGEFRHATKKFADLIDTIVCVEYNVNTDLKFHWDCYEWAPAE